MERQVLLDVLSEFLMVEQGGLQLYRVALSRCQDPALSERYQEFAHQTAHHREVLTKLIIGIGGNPDYVSPGARCAQYKATKLMETTMHVATLSPEEIEISDLENIVIAETKDHSNWELLKLLAKNPEPNEDGKGEMQPFRGTDEPVLESGLDAETLALIHEAVQEVRPEEDQHLAWATEMLLKKRSAVLMDRPAPSPMRLHDLVITGKPPITEVHPAVISEMLLPPSQAEPREPTPASRELALANQSERG